MHRFSHALFPTRSALLAVLHQSSCTERVEASTRRRRLIWERRHPRRWLLAVGAYAAVFLMGKSHPAAAASAEDCRAFHQECTEARAAGYRDVGICNVERLECPADPDAGVPKRSHEARDDDGHDPERAVGERSIGP